MDSVGPALGQGDGRPLGQRPGGRVLPRLQGQVHFHGEEAPLQELRRRLLLLLQPVQEGNTQDENPPARQSVQSLSALTQL